MQNFPRAFWNRTWKKRCVLIFLTVVLFVSLGLAPVGTNNLQPKSPEIQVYIDGSLLTMDTNPLLIQGRTLVPLRAIFEALGAKVEWNQTEESITAVKDNISIYLHSDSTIAMKNNTQLILDVPAQVVKDRTLVPLRFVSEALGASVSWDGANRRVSIYSNASGKADIFYIDKVAVLMYHHIDHVESGATITPERFAEHLDTLTEKGYNVISLHVLRAFLKGEVDVPPNAVVLTFDDGYESFYHYAYPLLKERKMTATVFMIVKCIGVKEGQIPKLDWCQMQEMLAGGMSFHSHTYDSHYYQKISHDGRSNAALVSQRYFPRENRQETQVEYATRIYEDLKKSKDVMEQELEVEIDFFSPPFGLKNERVAYISKQLGLNYIFTITPGLVKKTTLPTSLPRINAGSPQIDGARLHEIISTTDRQAIAKNVTKL